MRYASSSTPIGYNGLNSHDHTQSWESVGSYGIDYDNNPGYHYTSIGTVNGISDKMLRNIDAHDYIYGTETAVSGRDADCGNGFESHYPTFGTDKGISDDLYSKNPSDMMEEIYQKEEGNMSLSGIMFGSNGIVGFSDSRNTAIVNGEKRFLDDDTQKVFVSPNFITVTWGTNTYIHDSIQLPLSKLLLELSSGPAGTHRKIAEQLKEELKETFLISPTANYHFLFGFKETFCDRVYFGVEECVITRPGIQYLNLGYGCGVRAAGFLDYYPKNAEVYQGYTLKEMESRCRMLVQSAISLGDAFMEYNPVGGPTQIETLC